MTNWALEFMREAQELGAPMYALVFAACCCFLVAGLLRKGRR
jgi:hypothetical protein